MTTDFTQIHVTGIGIIYIAWNTMRTIWTEEDEAIYIELLLDEAFKGNENYTKDNDEAFNRIVPIIEERRGKTFPLNELRRKFYALLYRCSLWEEALKCRRVRWNQTLNVLESRDDVWEDLLQWAQLYRHEGERYWWEFSIIFAYKLPVDELAVLPPQLPPIEWGDTVEPSKVKDTAEPSEVKDHTAEPSEVKENTDEERDKKKQRIE
ncbi:hypothetical protein ACJIZ3_019938 [Penstemon smallii]|uniref:Myb/SANT-like domain-containing protein n=1 Tax=Penstemon smallii TaxID=265156 RepID=A0ABD3T3D6_9LAMI